MPGEDRTPVDQESYSGSPSATFSSSGYLTPALVGLLCAGLLAASYERGHGHFHKITDAVRSAPTSQTQGPNAPGGEDAIRLTRTATTIGTQPEFLSATVLPGRGLEVFQITASIPGHGEVPLLFSTTLPQALDDWTDTGADAHGALGAGTAGAFVLPWAGRLFGTPGTTPDSLNVDWQGKTLTVPAQAEGANRSTAGMILDRAVENVTTSVLPDGQALEATLHAGNFGGGWPSTIDVAYRVELTGHALVLVVRATNTGSAPTPIGIGWRPHFAIPSGDRAAATLTIPSTSISATDQRSGQPTGRTTPTADTSLDLVRASGTPLGSREVNATYTDLLAGSSADGPIAVLRDPGFNYVLRIVPLSSSITRLRVEAPAQSPWVMIAPQTNDEDPTGSEWQSPDNSGLATLAPGASMTWKVRLEIASITNAADLGSSISAKHPSAPSPAP